MSRSLAALLGLALLALLAVTGCSGSNTPGKAESHSPAKPVVLTLTTPFGTEDLERFLGTVQMLSQDAIRIRVKDGAHHEEGADFEEQTLLDVKKGKADLAAVGSRAFDTTHRSLGALTAPLLITSYDAQDKVLAAPVARRMVTAMDGDGLTGIGLLPGGLRRPFGARTAPLGPDDYKGRTFGITQSAVADSTLRALGAKPEAFPAGGSVNAFDGYEQQLTSVADNEYDRNGMIAAANVVLWPRPVALVASTKAMRRLTGQQRAILRKAAQQAVSDAAALRNRETDARDILCLRHQKFVTASTAQLAALRRAVRPVYDNLARDSQTKANLDDITALVKNMPPEPTLTCKGTPGAGISQ